jgi:hypothetical protein
MGGAPRLLFATEPLASQLPRDNPSFDPILTSGAVLQLLLFMKHFDRHPVMFFRIDRNTS